MASSKATSFFPYQENLTYHNPARIMRAGRQLFRPLRVQDQPYPLYVDFDVDHWIELSGDTILEYIREA
jgi:hypothetical protein